MEEEDGNGGGRGGMKWRKRNGEGRGGMKWRRRNGMGEEEVE